ncbi:unnamed protein product, partial [Cochlearia groenlandica]
MGEIIGDIINGIGKVTSNIGKDVFKATLGRSCQNICWGPLDLECFIRNLCLGDIGKMILIIFLCLI